MFNVPFIYLRICFADVRCTCRGSARYWDSLLTANAISGLVAIARNINLPIMRRNNLWFVLLSLAESPSSSCTLTMPRIFQRQEYSSLSWVLDDLNSVDESALIHPLSAILLQDLHHLLLHGFFWSFAQCAAPLSCVSPLSAR